MGDTFNIGGITAGNSVVGGTGNTVSGDGRVDVPAPAGLPADQVQRLEELLRGLTAELARHAPGELHEAAQAERELAEGRPGRLRVLVERLALSGTALTAVAEIQAALGQLGF
ncbi:hypothetical protein EDD29_2360 [Actinocorallia herbida]|uniref:Uncharacterized protein n=1 Tax=Actinocorallia herbida TaxID=58109 RepID=A0A3N1CU41_9ACTN|nr:hypothetical protein [Actinocorallia herbida]ROO84831.1 hypothetical protein EDD29_2360 [Actinocorallia herbida]